MQSLNTHEDMSKHIQKSPILDYNHELNSIMMNKD